MNYTIKITYYIYTFTNLCFVFFFLLEVSLICCASGLS